MEVICMKRIGASPSTVADMVKAVTVPPLPVRITAYDGSVVGPASSGLELHVVSPRAFSYMASAPGELGLARAYIMGKITMRGVEPGDPYNAFDRLEQLRTRLRRPSVGDARRILLAGTAFAGPRSPRSRPRRRGGAPCRAYVVTRSVATGNPSPPTTIARTASTRWCSGR